MSAFCPIAAITFNTSTTSDLTAYSSFSLGCINVTSVAPAIQHPTVKARIKAPGAAPAG